MRLAVLLVALLCLTGMGLTGCATPKPEGKLEGYAGTWVLRWQDRNLMVLALKSTDAGLSGILATPNQFEVSSDGTFSKIAGPVVESPISAELRVKAVQLTVNKPDEQTTLVMNLADPQHAELRFTDAQAWMAPMAFTRAADGEQPKVATDWTVTYPPDITAVQTRLQEMAKEDQAIRFAAKISNRAMDEMSARHRPQLERIHTKYGWPKQSQFGIEAAHKFWLLVQHQGPELQRAWLPELDQLQKQDEASVQDYALLYDRVQVGLGKPQMWGSQTKCVEGKAVMDPVENPGWLSSRRNIMHMQPIEEYLASLNESCAKRVP